jgi:hypothetical protein
MRTARITSTQLAWLAEAADGMQSGEQLVLARVQENGGPPRLGLVEKARQGDFEVIAEIESDSLVADRVKVTGLQIRLDGTDEWIECRTPEGPADAVFCTESAMQKFLITYYHNQRLLDRKQWNELDKQIRNKTLAAILHVAPSHSYALFQDETIQQVVGAQQTVAPQKSKCRLVKIDDLCGAKG